MYTLEDMRGEIEAIDAQIVGLWAERLACSRKIGAYKQANQLPVRDVKRERELWDKWKAMLPEASLGITLRPLFDAVLFASRAAQYRDADDCSRKGERKTAIAEKEMKILVLHGPNMGLLGMRETDIYGNITLGELNCRVLEYAAKKGMRADFVKSNYEGELIDSIHEACGFYDGLIINAAALTHYSYALFDALKAVDIPAVEVHLSDISKREPFRSISVIRPACRECFYGEGAESYFKAVDFLWGLLSEG